MTRDLEVKTTAGVTVYYAQNDFKDAIAAYEDALVIDPDRAEAYFGLATAFQELLRSIHREDEEFNERSDYFEDAVEEQEIGS